MRKIVSLLLLSLLTASIALADDAFYETRLAAGKQAYVEKRMPDAVTDLRIAAFGFLERPALLSETLVWLALAESASNRPERVRWALTRFLEVETKFRPYKQLLLDAPSRAAFEKILVATLSQDSIASIPTLAELVTRRPQAPAKAAAAKPAPPPATSQKIVPVPAVALQPIVPKPVPAPTPTSAAAQQTSAAREPQTMPDVQPRPAVPPADEQAAETIEKAKSLLNQNKNEEAFKALTALVAKTPSRTARKYLLHAATRTHQWQLAVSQIPQVEPFLTGEEVTMFYAAIALYQTGKIAAARPLLERSLPGVNPSPFVDEYKQRILGR